MPLQGKVLGSVPSRHFIFDILKWSCVCKTGIFDVVASKYYAKYFPALLSRDVNSTLGRAYLERLKEELKMVGPGAQELAQPLRAHGAHG